MIQSNGLILLTEVRKKPLVNVENQYYTKSSATETTMNSSDTLNLTEKMTLASKSSSSKHLQNIFENTSIGNTSCNDVETMKLKNNSVSTKLVTKKVENEKRGISSLLGHALRIALLDFPVLVVLLTYFCLLWMGHVRIQYLKPQIDALYFVGIRHEQEITYYKRICTVDDMSTLDGSDLFLPQNVTPEEAYQHQLKHGFSVFPSVLSEKTAYNLRHYIDQRNRKLLDKEKIFVIAGDHRYSFGLGTEEPTVAAALKEFATSPTLVPALEKILGKDPALIEMTAITSSYQAKAQFWHDDVIQDASAINYVRAFGPSYSIFIQLQNTTKEMGATAACPGTHYCSDGHLVRLCEQHGFPLLNAEHQHWGVGDALLMNMNNYHRGSAHTDPNASDRVMLILTFVPKPMDRVESRQMSQGITFSLRWDMWGHTLYDLAHADTSMKQPWAILRALGLYKKDTKASWGIDYISGGSMRLANGDHGFRDEDLENWMKWGGFQFLPSSLEGKVDDESFNQWYDYYSSTLELCTQFMKKLSIVSIVGYLALFGIVNIILWLYRYESSTSSRKKRLPSFIQALTRISFMISILYYLLFRMKKHVDETDWAADIKGQRRYAGTVKYDHVAFMDEDIDEINSPSTFPTKFDVLVETRYGSDQFEIYNDFISNHPGNRLFQNYLQQNSDTFQQYPVLFQEASAAYILETIGMEHGRFLMQNPSGSWLWMTYDDSMEYIKKQLAVESNPILKRTMRVIRSLTSDMGYGIHRDTALAQKHSRRFLKSVEKRLYNSTIKALVTKPVEGRPKQSNIFQDLRTFRLPIFSSNARRVQRKISITRDLNIQEPTVGAWLSAGDVVETSISDGYWYYGTIQNVSAHAWYVVKYSEEASERIDIYDLRPVGPYGVGEHLEVMVPAEEFYYAGVIVFYDIARTTFSIHVPDLHKTLYDVKPEDLRRPGEPLTIRPSNDGGYHL